MIFRFNRRYNDDDEVYYKDHDRRSPRRRYSRSYSRSRRFVSHEKFFTVAQLFLSKLADLVQDRGIVAGRTREAEALETLALEAARTRDAVDQKVATQKADQTRARTNAAHAAHRRRNSSQR